MLPPWGFAIGVANCGAWTRSGVFGAWTVILSRLCFKSSEQHISTLSCLSHVYISIIPIYRITLIDMVIT